MSAIATQYNPDGTSADEIFVFYNDKDALLGFELVDAQSTDVVTYDSASISTKGFIRNPSQLAAIHFKRVVSTLTSHIVYPSMRAPGPRGRTTNQTA